MVNVRQSVVFPSILPWWWLQSDMPIGLDPLWLPAPCNLPAYDTSTNWRQQWSLKWPLLSLCCPPSFFPLSLHFTSCVSSHLTCSCTKHLAPLLSPSLHVFASSISGHPHNCSLPIKHTHTHTTGLRFWGSYDTIQILLAAYSGEIVFCAEPFPSEVQIFLAKQLWSTWHGGLVSTVLCFSWRAQQTPIVSLIALCHCLGS